MSFWFSAIGGVAAALFLLGYMYLVVIPSIIWIGVQ